MAEKKEKTSKSKSHEEVPMKKVIKTSRTRNHRPASTRKCLSRSSKILYHGLPSWFLKALNKYEIASRK